jgi:hypothetical protein
MERPRKTVGEWVGGSVKKCFQSLVDDKCPIIGSRYQILLKIFEALHSLSDYTPFHTDVEEQKLNSLVTSCNAARQGVG